MAFFKIINQYERGVLFTFGRYTTTLSPGLNVYIPLLQDIRVVDTRVKTIDIPKQEIMTKDNVPVNINAVIYFKIKNAENAVLKVVDVIYATSKYGQAALRNVTGEAELDELLTERQKLAEKLRRIVDQATDPWGIDVTAIELQDIELPENMKRTMAKQAEAEREKRAVIINSEGEVEAAKNIAQASKNLYSAPGALHLRTLHSINDLSSDNSNTLVYALPIELLRGIERLTDFLEDKNKK
ncbi:MAG: slipin family protein [Candidatus Altiarchaeales archaeon]|nr:slipin family protein [Candidatus Altiarchaeales archaeon]